MLLFLFWFGFLFVCLFVVGFFCVFYMNNPAESLNSH